MAKEEWKQPSGHSQNTPNGPMSHKPQRAGLRLGRWISRSCLAPAQPFRDAFIRAYFAYKRHVEDPCENLLAHHRALVRGGHVIDVGACIGYTACVFAHALDPGFRVWALEPVASNFRRLQAVVAARGLQGRITPIRAAAGDHLGSTGMVVDRFHLGNHHVSDGRSARASLEPVELVTIDDMARRRGIAPVAIIKIDVQGYELEVCRGMTAVLDVNPGVTVILEYAPADMRRYGDEPHELVRFFTDRGYHVYRVTRRGHVITTRPGGLPDPLPWPGYVNLLFRKTALEAAG